jgi:hypothetical protein
MAARLAPVFALLSLFSGLFVAVLAGPREVGILLFGLGVERLGV